MGPKLVDSELLSHGFGQRMIKHAKAGSARRDLLDMHKTGIACEGLHEVLEIDAGGGSHRGRW
jgi:hypothetical protein